MGSPTGRLTAAWVWPGGHVSAGAAGVALEVLVPRDKSRGVQEVGAPGLALWLRGLDADRRPETST